MLILFLGIFSLVSTNENVLNDTITTETNQQLIAQLTACWVISVQELTNKQQLINSIIIQQLTENVNRQTVFYKIQTNMIEQCIQNAQDEDLNQIMQSILDDTKNYKTFQEIIPNYNYTQFNETNYEWSFTKTDQTLMKYIRQFESWIDSKQQQNTNEDKKPINNTEINNKTRESVFSELKKKLNQINNKQTTDTTKEKQDQLDKLLFYQQKQKSMKDPSNYIYATITFVGFAIIIYFIYNKIKDTNVDPRLEKKNKKIQKKQQ